MASNPLCPHFCPEKDLVFDWSAVDIVDGDTLSEGKLDKLSWAAADCDSYNSPNYFDDVAVALNYHWNENQISHIAPNKEMNAGWWIKIKVYKNLNIQTPKKMQQLPGWKGL